MTSNNEITPDKPLDVRGDVCPRPRMLARMALSNLEVGQVLRVLGDYGPSLANIRRDATEEGQTVLRAEMVGEVEWEIIVRKEE